jgi:hypothetical protein
MLGHRFEVTLRGCNYTTWYDRDGAVAGVSVAVERPGSVVADGRETWTAASGKPPGPSVREVLQCEREDRCS